MFQQFYWLSKTLTELSCNILFCGNCLRSARTTEHQHIHSLLPSLLSRVGVVPAGSFQHKVFNINTAWSTAVKQAACLVVPEGRLQPAERVQRPQLSACYQLASPYCPIAANRSRHLLAWSHSILVISVLLAKTQSD